MKVLFLTRYGQVGGSSRYMVHQYLEFYERAGIQCTVHPLFDSQYFTFQLIDRPTGLAEIMQHSRYFFGCVTKRLWHLASSPRYDLVVFEKELLPYVPYGLEVVLKALQPKSIVLFDDATWAYYRAHPFTLVRFMCRGKIEAILRNCAHVIVWNDFLANYAREFNASVSVVNTAIDLRRYRVKHYEETTPPKGQPTVIGWIGTPNSFCYVQKLEDVFGRLARQHDLELHVISSQDYASPNVRVVNKRWNLQTEIDDLRSLDIGIMPLTDDEWTWGKSGVKAVQYMGVGVPAVCSAVGVATQIIQDGVNGCLATTQQEWAEKLGLLIETPTMRREMGLRGREAVEQAFSLQAVAPKLINILQTAASGKKTIG